MAVDELLEFAKNSGVNSIRSFKIIKTDKEDLEEVDEFRKIIIGRR